MATYRHVIEVEGRFIDNLTNSADSASHALAGVGDSARKATVAVTKLGSTDAEPDIGIDTSEFMGEMNKVDRLLDKFKKIHTAALNIKDSGAYQTLKKITDTAENLTKKAWQVGVGILDKATAPIRAIKNALFSIPTLITAVVSAKIVQAGIINPINTADAYSGALSGFSNQLGDTAGQKMMDDLDAFALKTPFKTSGVIDNAQKMLAMGWSAETLIEDMEIIGDAAAATGKLDQGLESIVRALAQIKTKGKLSSEELNQLAEAGLAAKPILAEALGYGTGDAGLAALSADLEDGAIGSEKAIEALLTGMQKYKGMMDAMANEQATGLIGQIQDAFEVSVVRRWGQGLQDGAKRGLGTVVELLDEAREGLDEFGETLYDIGYEASNWVADRFENMMNRVLEITDTFEFKNATLKEKISMLWNGVIADPLKEWWEGGGREKTAETAGKIGNWMGTTLTKGLLAMFGVTDILKEGGIDKDGGASIAQSFAQGFVDGFDVDAVTEKLSQAISNVWNFLPWWAKTLLVGYGGSKLAIGGMNVIGSVAGGIEGAKNLIGSASKMTGLLGFGTNAAISLGAGNLAGGASLGGAALSTIGLGATAGGIATVAGLGHIVKSAYDSHKAFEQGDETTGRAERARAVGTGVGMVTGAGAGLAATAIGAKIGTGVGALFGGVGAIPGALIGAGLGTVVGWFAGDKIAKNIEAARYETEGLDDAYKDAETTEEQMAVQAEAMYNNAKRHFGEIKLSMEEIATLADKIVWGDDLTNFESFTTATKTAEANLQTLKSSAQDTDKWMWKAGLGVKFDEDEKEAFIASCEEYITAAQSYLENKHYEFSTSAALLLDVESEEGKTIVEAGNVYYAQIQSDLDSLSGQLSEKLHIALDDGVISTEKIELPDGTLQLSEWDEIVNLQNQIAEITRKVSEAETNAELELIKVKFGAGNLDNESFENFLDTMSTTIEERVAAADQAFEVQVTNLALRYPDKGPEYDAELQALIDGYTAKVESVKAEVKDVELNMVADAYASELGDDVRKDLENALNEAIKSDKPIATIDDATLGKWLGLDNIEGHEVTLDNIRSWLAHVMSQLDTLEVEEDVLLELASVKVDGDVAGEAQAAVDEMVPEFVRADAIEIMLTGDVEALNQLDTVALAEEFNIPEEVVEDVLVKLSGEKTILERIDVLAKDFGIDEEEAFRIWFNLYGTKSIQNSLETTPDEFNIQETDEATTKWTITGEVAKVNPVANPPAIQFGILPSRTFTQTINIKGVLGSTSLPNFSGQTYAEYRQSRLPKNNFRGGFVGGSTALEAFANGGFVSGGARLIKVAEEGTPEAIIPLGSHRRKRGIELWEKTGEMLGVAGFANGGFTRGNRDEGIRFRTYSGGESQVSNDVHVEMGGVSVTVQVDARGAENVVETIKAQSHEIAETVAGILADELGDQFSNTPRKAS